MNDLLNLLGIADAEPVAERTTKVREHDRRVRPTVTPRARRTDPPTAKAAARKLELSADNDRGRTLLALVDGGAQHDFELAERLGRKQTSIGVRRKELVTLGLAERAPVKPRPNADGSLCIVWQATEAGIAKARELRGTT